MAIRNEFLFGSVSFLKDYYNFVEIPGLRPKETCLGCSDAFIPIFFGEKIGEIRIDVSKYGININPFVDNGQRQLLRCFLNNPVGIADFSNLLLQSGEIIMSLPQNRNEYTEMIAGNFPQRSILIRRRI